MRLRQIVALVLLLGMVLGLTACITIERISTSVPGEGVGAAGATPAAEGQDTPATAQPTQMGSIAVSDDIRGRIHAAPLLPPHSGMAALFVHRDDRLELMTVVTSNIALSSWMTGELDNRLVNVRAEVGLSRATGRFEVEGLSLNYTIPGQGYMRAAPVPVDGAAMYKGELNGLTAALLVMPDGQISGFAAVQGGDAPVYELLCVDGGIEGTPEQVTAKTCDSGQEVALTLITD